MEKVFESVWDEVQDRVEKSVRLNLLSKNIEPTRKVVEDELDRRMLVLVDKLCKLAME